MAKSERKQREFERREQEIIEAAYSLFKQGDIHVITIEQVAEATGIGKGTVYKHFKSKDEIYARIIIQLNRDLYAEIASIDPALPFQQRLNQIIEAVWQSNMRDMPFIFQLTLHVRSGAFRKNLGAEMLQSIKDFQQEHSMFYLQLLADAQQRGEIINEPLEDLLISTSAAIDGAIMLYWQMETAGRGGEEVKQHQMHLIQKFVNRALGATKDNDSRGKHE